MTSYECRASPRSDIDCANELEGSMSGSDDSLSPKEHALPAFAFMSRPEDRVGSFRVA